MKAGLGARTASSELSLRPQGFGGSKGASPARGAGERLRPAVPAPGPSRVAQQQQQQQQEEEQQEPAAPAARERPPAAAPRRPEDSEDGTSAGGSARLSEAGGGGGGLTETEVHGHIESITKLLFGQADDTGETPEALLGAVVESADDVGGALQELLRQCLDVRGPGLEERLEKPKVGSM
jgi:hypothetical protein